MKKILLILLFPVFCQAQSIDSTHISMVIVPNSVYEFMDSLHSVGWVQNIIQTTHNDYQFISFPDTADSAVVMNGVKIPLDTLLYQTSVQNLNNMAFYPLMDSLQKWGFNPQQYIQDVTIYFKKQ